MIGLNGGLIGKDRSTAAAASVPGVWTLGEQLKAKRSFLWPFNAGEDPYFANVSLLLRGDGANGSTTFVDSSSNNFTITPYGNAQISTAQSKFSGASMYFDGNGDYLQTPSDSDLTLGASDFTIECWAYFVTLDSNTTVMRTSTGSNIQGVLFAHTGSLLCYATSNGGTWNIMAGASLGNAATGAWHHLALTRQGSTFRGFLNGVLGFTVSSTASIYQLSPIARIGAANDNGAFAMNGYIDDLRITKGIARYTANFTPPGAL